jgi:hypothetical protein
MPRLFSTFRFPLTYDASTMRRLALMLFLVVGTSAQAHAQIDDLNVVLRGGIEDAELLLTRYIEPFAAGFGAGLNSGWTHNARPHNVLGFHVRASVGLSMVPTSDRSFEVSQNELNQLRLLNPGINSSPTVAGSSRDDTYRFAVEANGQPTGQEFAMPEGTGFPFVPVPFLQAGIGLVNGTSLMLRGFPSIGLGSYGTIGSFGVGVQHGLNQWIPGGSLLPLQFSVQAGYTTLNMSAEFDDADYADQELSWRTNAWTVNVIAGRSFIFFNAYGGLGYETSSSRLQLNGTYEVGGPNANATVRDPIDITLDGANAMKAFVGVRFNLALIGVRAEYTLAEYPTFNAGLSLSMR